MSGNAAADVASRLGTIRDRAIVAAPVAAAEAAGRAGQTTVRALLLQRAHARGTRTPSPPGSPPARISGTLAASVQKTAAVATGPGLASITWGSAIIYAPVQEYGDTIRVKNARILADRETGQFFGLQVTLPERPFMRPGTERLEATGTFTVVTSDAFRAALGF